VTFEFRASSPSDAGAIVELCERVLPVPPRSRVFARDHLRWKYWDPWPSWPGSRSFLLLAAGRLVAHAGIVPLPFARERRAHTLVQLIDWAADPAHVGAGAVLLKRIAALADGAVSVRGSTMTQRMLKPLGFRSLGETIRYAAPVIDGSAPLASALARAATVRIHTRETLATRGGDSRLREHPLAHAESSGSRIVLQRSAAQITAWLACPVATMHHGEVFVGDAMLGSFLVCLTPGQARIVDAWADEQLPGAWDAVLELAYRHGCRQPGANEVVFQGNDAAQQRALEACGFVAVGSDPLAILASPALVNDGASLRHHLIDSDLGYLHHEEPESWTK
jgi:hypothetical protein